MIFSLKIYIDFMVCTVIKDFITFVFFTKIDKELCAVKISILIE